MNVKLGVNKIRRDRARNTEIRNSIGVPSCIEQKRLKWFGHLVGI
jgi:hypothetical protein